MRFTDQEIFRIYQTDGECKVKATARLLGLDPKTVRRSLHRSGVDTEDAKPLKKSKILEDIKDSITREFNQDSAFISTKSLNVKTLDEALKVAEVDMTTWEVERYVINSWEVTMGVHATNDIPATYTNWQVKVWLKPKTVVNMMVDVVRELIKEIPKLKVPNIVSPVVSSRFALEVAPYDIHFGKLAWGRETQQGDYDIEIAAEWFLKSIKGSIDFSAPFKIEKIFYILGQDLMHVENIWGVTPVGQNRLDMDTRLPKIYLKAKESTIQALYMLRKVAPVEVLWVPGNHDIHASYFLSEVIKEHFGNDKHVMVDNTPPWRKARLWGNLLVGFAHDASGRLGTVTVNQLAQFWPELWGLSKYRELHTGHKHKKQETKFMPVHTEGGVLVRQIPTLSTIDAWHYQEGFTDAVPAGESFLWSKDNGINAHYTVNVSA